MLHEYLKEHIHEEIEGAIDYLTKAVELKPKHPDLAAKFKRMSEMEVDHAACLTKMFTSTEKPAEMKDSEYSTLLKSIMDNYTTSMSKFENLKKLYMTS